MDHVLAGQFVCRSDFGESSVAAIECFAFSQKVGACSGMDSAILGLVSTKLQRFPNRRTTPPPPRSDVFAALTMEVTSRSVMDVLISVILEFRAEKGGNDVSSWFAGSRVRSL